MYSIKLAALICALLQIVQCSDITNLVFGGSRDGLPAAFGDFNSDELTDVFVLRNKRKTVEVLLASDEEPFLRGSSLKCNFSQVITSVVPGDFDGDAFMDILVTTAESLASKENNVHVIWGGLDHLNCSDEQRPLLRVHGQPLAIDYNQDMIIDLFGVDTEGQRTFWIFDNARNEPQKQRMQGYNERNHIRRPHANAFLDLNGDDTADLFVTGKEQLEVWHGAEDGGFALNETFEISAPGSGERYEHVGQSLFLDVQLQGRMQLLTPVCADRQCRTSALLLRPSARPAAWLDLQLVLRDPADGTQWGFVRPDSSASYKDAITLRPGDYNMDGYPDLLATLQAEGRKPRAFLLENVPCGGLVHCSNLTSRTFQVRWDNALTAAGRQDAGVLAAAFYDFYQDGILDVLLVFENGTAGALRNGLDYDANFVKVMVLTGLSNVRSPTVVGRLGKRKRRTYGTNLPGPSVSYHTTTQEGGERHGASAQLAQSAHNTLGLPFSMFGLGRTPNFVDQLTVGLGGKFRHWTQIIPNSQMVVIPWPTSEPARWRAQLFVTPSKLILMSVAALTAVCGLITCLIAALYARERKEDRKERLQESHRFHFDAM